MGAYVLVRDRVGHEDSTSEPADSSIQLSIHNVHDTDVEYMVIDLYAVRPESHEIQKKGDQTLHSSSQFTRARERENTGVGSV